MNKLFFSMFFGLCVLVALRPMMESTQSSQLNDSESFPGWPLYLNGQLLIEKELTDYDQYFYRNLPGELGSFETNDAEVIMRWVETPTRLLHSSSHCFRSQGYTVDQISLKRDRFEKNWHVFKAFKEGHVLSVRERIEDTTGRSWSDFSAWYWDCLLGRTKAPWWNYVIVERG